MRVHANRVLRAAFSQQWCTLCITTNTGTGTGSVTTSPPGPTYISGTVVTLTAHASPGSTFVGWSGDASGSNPSTTVTMNSNKSVTATFNSPNPPHLTETCKGKST